MGGESNMWAGKQEDRVGKNMFHLWKNGGWRQHPDSLLCFCLAFLVRSTLLRTCPRLISESVHVPAHPFEQASVDLGQVRRRLTVEERGQPQPSEANLTDEEVRHTGNESEEMHC